MPSNLPTIANRDREGRMREKLYNHESIEDVDDMSGEFYEHLTNLMLWQADTELAGTIRSLVVTE